MRCSSPCSSGLLSTDSGKACPLRQRTQRLSPIEAQQTTAVQPEVIPGELSGSSGCFLLRISTNSSIDSFIKMELSSSINASFKPSTMSIPFWYFLLERM
ncbi:hypothetical protein TYRP_000361 [Tyrophagus putrescentiae]|nr:hypothetical protein TYRP_000361 [Tyrophagus putrescentiae]